MQEYTNASNEPLSLLIEPVSTYGPSRITSIRKGLPFNAISNFVNKTGLTRQELANVLQVSVRTLQRHESDSRLSPSISEKLLNLNDIYQLTTDSLSTNPKDITDWLRKSNTALGSDSPLSVLDTYIGIQQVQGILGRMSHGVFS